MPEFYSRAIVWLRRDLRLSDNVALARAAGQSREICIAFNLDPVLLGSDRIGAPIVQTFFDALGSLRKDLRRRGSDLALLQGDFSEQLTALARRINARAVYYNEDYDPSAIERDARVSSALRSAGVDVHASLDHVYFGAGEIRTGEGDPYKVFTAYKNRWRRRHVEYPRMPADSEKSIAGKLIRRDSIGETRDVPEPEEFGFRRSASYPCCSEGYALSLLDVFVAPRSDAESYADRRDFPALDGTSHLSPQLRAGTVGVRTCFLRAFEAAERPCGAQVEKWIDELIWREFYQSILKSYPYVDGAPFIDAAAHIVWRNDPEEFARWCHGETGYPIVDAAMRQLNKTGWMHNRLRMIVASFLTKHLLIDWRWGERYFEQHLADADLAQNNGGWQWSASTGTDAAPYFRIFNPIAQSKKFDPEGSFIKRMLPELANVPPKHIHAPWEIDSGYPQPIIDHAFARDRALAAYGSVLGRRAKH